MMTTETQVLLTHRRKIRKEMYEAITNNILSTLNALGAVQGVTSSYTAMFRCDDPADTACMENASITSFYVGLGAAYTTLIVQILGDKFTNVTHKERLKIINTIICQFMQMLTFHNFYLMAGNSIISDQMKTNNIPDPIFWTRVFLPVLALTLLTPTPYIRYKIRERFCDVDMDAPRDWRMKFVDMYTALLEGAATMIMTMSGITQIRDIITHQLKRGSPHSWTFSDPGMIARYTCGGVWGVGQTVLRSKWPAITSLDKITMSRWPSTLQNLLGTTTLIIMMGLSIFSLESSLHKSLIGGLALLLFVLSIGAAARSTMCPSLSDFFSRNNSPDQTNFPSLTSKIQIKEDRPDTQIRDLTQETPSPQAEIQTSIKQTDLPAKNQNIVNYVKDTGKNFSYKLGHSLKDIVFHHPEETQEVAILPSEPKLETNEPLQEQTVYGR